MVTVVVDERENGIKSSPMAKRLFSYYPLLARREVIVTRLTVNQQRVESLKESDRDELIGASLGAIRYDNDRLMGMGPSDPTARTALMLIRGLADCENPEIQALLAEMQDDLSGMKRIDYATSVMTTALEKLCDGARSILDLYYNRGLSCDTIAEKYGKKFGFSDGSTCNRKIHQTLKKLEELLIF